MIMANPDRRQLLFGGAALLASALAAPTYAQARRRFPFTRTDAQWRALLSADAYAVLRQHGTERPGSSPLVDERRTGVYHCVGCNHPLYPSRTKYSTDTGWPSFYQPLPRAIGTSVDRSLGMVRTEVHCANCGGHLGHVFNDGPRPTGLRYCMNGVAMRFRPA
jgi:peptide-methionine (R)-S-oxide reductase